ncbi:MAG: zinc transporter ZntB [Sphingomonadales bacterium]
MTARCYIVDAQGPRKATREEATAALGKAPFVWVHFDQCDAATEAWLTGFGDVTPLVAAAMLATETRPRMEPIDSGALINLRGLDDSKGHNPDLLSSVRVWVAKGRAFSVTRRDLSAMDTVQEALCAGKVTDPGDFVSLLASAITLELDPDVSDLGDTLDDCEEQVGTRANLSMRRIIAETRSRAIAYRRFLAPQRSALERMAQLSGDWLNDDDRLHINEAADRAARMAEELEAIRERSALLHEQLTDLRAEMIDTRGLLISVVALIFLPLTFLTGLLGMNVDGIPYAHEPWAFWGVVIVCVGISIGVAAYFMRAHWFR